jgi:hypothetical protein
MTSIEADFWAEIAQTQADRLGSLRRSRLPAHRL